jgi:hypothetical protein
MGLFVAAVQKELYNEEQSQLSKDQMDRDLSLSSRTILSGTEIEYYEYRTGNARPADQCEVRTQLANPCSFTKT